MGVLLTLLRKEFQQVFRNRAMLPILFVMPVVQLVVLSFAATFEVRETPMTVVDLDGTSTSEGLVRRLEASGYFTVARQAASDRVADDDIMSRRSRMVLSIPAGFASDLVREGWAPVHLVLNAEDGAAAGIVQSYAIRIIQAYAAELAGPVPAGGASGGPAIRVAAQHWYNAELDYKRYMVPGILVVLVTLIGTFLSSMNVVREKEIGTIEQLNVTPLRKSQFIVGKLLPFWILALFELAFGLVVARVIFGIIPEGSILLIFFLAGVFLVVMLGLGLFISTITETQQQAMFIAWFFLVIFILMSGLFTPIEAMPDWAQQLTRLNPLAYFIEIMRRVILKGAGAGAILHQLAALTLMAVVVLTAAVWRFRKTSA